MRESLDTHFKYIIQFQTKMALCRIGAQVTLKV